MTQADLTARLEDCFAAVFPGTPREAIPSASQSSVPEWDSLASVTLLALVQQEFQLEIGFTEMEHLLSFGEARSYIARRMGLESERSAV